MSFKWIHEDYTGFTAVDATGDNILEDDDLEISGIMIGDTKEIHFRLGNTGTSEASFQISASGVNSTIVDDVEFSEDNGLSWLTPACVSGLAPNEVSDLIRCKYTPAEGEITGTGSFLIRVDEE